MSADNLLCYSRCLNAHLLRLLCHAGFLNWLYTCTGVLSCLDGYMNIALEQTEEYVNGVLTNSYGDAFVRGNNGEPVM